MKKHVKLNRCRGSFALASYKDGSVRCPVCLTQLHAVPRRDGLAAVPAHAQNICEASDLEIK